MAASNLLQFKRGTYKSLQTLIANKSGEDGTFYLAVDDPSTGSVVKDSSRLYVGRADGSIVPVNQGITAVSSVNDLVAGSGFQEGDFAYVVNGNILAIYDGNQWIQINRAGEEALINNVTMKAAVGDDGVATITTTVAQKGGAYAKSGSTKIAGAGGITLSTANGTTTITGDQYKIAASEAKNNSTNVSLTSDKGHNSGFAVKGSDIVTVSTEKDADGNVTGVKIDSPNFRLANGQVNNKTTGTGFTIVYTQANGGQASANFDPKVTLGGDTATTYGFENGIVDLPVYTKDKIDSLFQGLDALHFIGTVGADGSTGTASKNGLTGLTNVNNGDLFKIVTDGISLTPALNYDTTTESITLKKGDTIIAIGTEDPKTGYITSPKYVYIPSGDEVDTNYKFTKIDHGVQLAGSTQTTTNSGTFALNAGKQVTLTDTGSGQNNTVTVAHATIVKQDNDTDTASSQTYNTTFTIPVITNISLDNGHVTKWTTKNYVAKDTHATLLKPTTAIAATTSGDGVTITTSMGLQHSENAVDTKATSFSLTSQNLTIAAATGGATVNMYWGTF